MKILHSFQEQNRERLIFRLDAREQQESVTAEPESNEGDPEATEEAENADQQTEQVCRGHLDATVSSVDAMALYGQGAVKQEAKKVGNTTVMTSVDTTQADIITAQADGIEAQASAIKNAKESADERVAAANREIQSCLDDPSLAEELNEIDSNASAEQAAAGAECEQETQEGADFCSDLLDEPVNAINPDAQEETGFFKSGLLDEDFSNSLPQTPHPDAETIEFNLGGGEV